MVERVNKLYVVVRGDLSPGSQAVQGIHAARQLVEDHPDDEMEWFVASNRIVLLAADDEVALLRLVDAVSRSGAKWSSFREPDLEGSMTAVAVLGSDDLPRGTLSKLRLALS